MSRGFVFLPTYTLLPSCYGFGFHREAGQLLRAHGFQFDLVYTSWLSRAVATAWHVLDEMDLLWLPIVKTWRLNERKSSLVGLSTRRSVIG